MLCGDGRRGRPTEVAMRWYEAVVTRLRLLQPQRPPHHAACVYCSVLIPSYTMLA
jgi:hypothetical protein